jgi:hypothetical protein
MTVSRKKILLWTGLVASVPAAGYFATAVVFYAWLSAASPDRWPPERAALWAYGSLALTTVFVVLFIYCLVSLIKGANKAYREERDGTLQ